MGPRRAPSGAAAHIHLSMPANTIRQTSMPAIFIFLSAGSAYAGAMPMMAKWKF